MRSGAIIYPILSSYSNLTSLVPDTSMFAVRVEQGNSAPYLVYREIASTPTNTNGPDASATTTDPKTNQRSILDVVAIQISCFGLTYLSVENIAYQVRMALDREWGATTSPYDTQVSLDSAVYDSCVDDYDEKYGDEGIFIKHLDFTLRINRLDID
tara:strand:+ start:2400 stop:2867 length:468 start_codon:yes stop_codon:yes gene_type:complete